MNFTSHFCLNKNYDLRNEIKNIKHFLRCVTNLIFFILHIIAVYCLLVHMFGGSNRPSSALTFSFKSTLAKVVFQPTVCTVEKYTKKSNKIYAMNITKFFFIYDVSKILRYLCYNYTYQVHILL